MKRFLIYTITFSVTFGIGCILIILLADGSADESYLKFTTPKQSAMIIGSSRAGQGILPASLNEQINNVDFYNYAFSIRNTPYGEPYFRSVKRKLNASTQKSIFILGVNPWTISSITEDPEDSLNFREIGSSIDRTHFVSMNPNVEYILESYQQKNMNFILKKFKRGDYQTFFVHDDGWLEVTIESDMFSTKERTRNKINSYKEKLEKEYSGFSKTRFHYLKEMISKLQDHGSVYLVRIPILSEMLELENILMPDFDQKMTELSKSLQCGYSNFMQDRETYEYTDGHHLTIDSARRFSDKLGKIIQEQEQKKESLD